MDARTVPTLTALLLAVTLLGMATPRAQAAPAPDDPPEDTHAQRLAETAHAPESLPSFRLPARTGVAPGQSLRLAVPGLAREFETIERFAPYVSSHGVRLLRLWGSERGSLVLQVGRHHAALLQWTSNPSANAEAPRGLLNDLVGSTYGAP